MSIMKTTIISNLMLPKFAANTSVFAQIRNKAARYGFVHIFADTKIIEVRKSVLWTLGRLDRRREAKGIEILFVIDVAAVPDA